MDLITREDLRQLVNGTGAPCVSFYLPTHRAGAETRQDPIRLKNLLREADQQLQAGGLGSPAITKLLDPVKGLLGDNDFWQHQGDGLAVFSSPNLFRLYRVQAQVPELAIVADQFHLKPLLGLMTGNNQFYVLALSQNCVRVFQATRETIVELESENMPDSLAEALRSRMPERQLQAHSAGGAHRAAIFHGHGGGEEDRKEMLVAYFRLVDAGIRDLLAQRSAPILLAAVDYLCPIYRQVNSNPELLEDWISGNPDNLTPQQLHEKAVPIAAAHSKKAQKRAADRYLELWHTQRASNSLADVLSAVSHGRVDLLFVAVGVQVWGRFDAATNETSVTEEPASQDQDLLNLAALHTFLMGGTVYAVPPAEVPGGASVAAVFRY